MRGLDFDDILLVPKPTKLSSRDDVSLNSPFKFKSGKNVQPIFSSPMKGVSGKLLIESIYKLGGYGILHRFSNYETRVEEIKALTNSGVEFGVAVGIRDMDTERSIIKTADFYGVNFICIDVANGYLERVYEFVYWIRRAFPNMNIMAGNVASGLGASRLANAGANFIRVGIGSGSVCTTRNMTGVGVPQLTALKDCSDSLMENNFDNVYIVADGGIRNSGDAVKSFVFGADFVMLGKLLASTIEAENSGEYYGMASERIQVEFLKDKKSVEGMQILIDNNEKKPIADFFEEFTYGIRSACTYLDAKNYLDLYGSDYIEVGKGSIKSL